MAHKHNGELYFILVDKKTGDAMYDSWADILTFDTKGDAETYLLDHELEDEYQVDTWIDW